MTRRRLFPLALGAMLRVTLFAKEDRTALRGHLVKGPKDEPAIRLAAGKVVRLAGDGQTVAVLKDPRLADMDFEVDGHYRTDGVFAVDPRYKDALWVHANGERLMVTYWCDVCSIRTYAPGKCMCCQQETRVDLIKPDAH